MSNRYFAQTAITGQSAELVGTEAHHLIHVMRATPGDRIVLFDGSGAEFNARIERITRSEVHLAVLDRTEVDRELRFELTLGVTLPKGDRPRWLVEKAVELGVAQLVPLVTTRSVAAPSTNAVARLGRAVIEASKQCGRNRLTEIAQPQSWSQFLSAMAAVPSRLFAHPSARQGKATVLSPRKETPQRLALAIGPEGGFTDDEFKLAIDRGWQPIDLGPRTLRIETAAIYMIALVVQTTEPWATFER